MRFANCIFPGNDARTPEAAISVDGRLYPLSSVIGWHGLPIGSANGSTLSRLADVLDEIRGAVDSGLGSSKSFDAAEVVFAPPVVPASSFRDFYAFEEHVVAARARRGVDMIPEWYEIPVFYFSNHLAFLAHGEELTFPPSGEWLDFELEVAAVIGREGRDIKREDAEDFIFGYAVLNDWSLRDAQKQEMKMNLGPAKGKDFASSFGPFLVTPDEIEDKRSGKGYDLEMVARVNGQEVSRGNWQTIYFGFPEMIERASRGVTLYPGDIIGSGTVGTGCILELGPENTGGWLERGDTVDLDIDRLGVLTTRIV